MRDPRGSKPGERRGGRAKGTPNKRKATRALAIKMAGVDPKQFLLNGLAFYQGRINEELARPKPDAKVVEAAYIAGKEFAKDAAPYCHARLQAVAHSGPDGGPIEMKDVSDSRETLNRKLARLAAGGGAAGVPSKPN